MKKTGLLFIHRKGDNEHSVSKEESDSLISIVAPYCSGLWRENTHGAAGKPG